MYAACSPIWTGTFHFGLAAGTTGRRGDRRSWDFAAGYIQRSAACCCPEGSSGPWKVHQNYLVERRLLRARGRMSRVAMEFRRTARRGNLAGDADGGLMSETGGVGAGRTAQARSR